MTYQTTLAAAGGHQAVRSFHLPTQAQGWDCKTNLQTETAPPSRQLRRSLIEGGSESAELHAARLELCRLFPDEGFSLDGIGLRAQGLQFAALLMVFAGLVGTIVVRGIG